MAGLVIMLVATAAVTEAARATVAGPRRTLAESVLPAPEATSDLATAYVDQETGQRGFLLTGDPVLLEPYEEIAAADRLHRRLADLVSADDEAAALLEAVQVAGERWRMTVADAGIEARRQGPLEPGDVDAPRASGKAQFDALRTTFDALENRTVELTRAQFARIRQARSIANVIAISVASSPLSSGRAHGRS